jgi:hypothetical protein
VTVDGRSGARPSATGCRLDVAYELDRCGWPAGCAVAAAVCLAGAAIVLAFLPSHPDSAGRPVAPSPAEPALGVAA